MRCDFLPPANTNMGLTFPTEDVKQQSSLRVCKLSYCIRCFICFHRRYFYFSTRRLWNMQAHKMCFSDFYTGVEETAGSTFLSVEPSIAIPSSSWWIGWFHTKELTQCLEGTGLYDWLALFCYKCPPKIIPLLSHWHIWPLFFPLELSLCWLSWPREHSGR